MEGSLEVGTKVKKKRKTKSMKLNEKEVESGMIYLSRIPQYMNVTKIRQIFGEYGEVGRLFLQPDEKTPAHKKKNRSFTEGWVEFLDKRVAKRVALTLNNTQVGGRKRNPWYEEIWNIKYLPKFKWGHLRERMEYEKAVRQQRMRVEVAQAKKETSFFARNVEKQKYIKKLEKKGKANNREEKDWTFRQNLTEDEILAQKSRESEEQKSEGRELPKAKKLKRDSTCLGGDDEGNPKKRTLRKAADNKSFLRTLFSGGVATKETSDEDS